MQDLVQVQTQGLPTCIKVAGRRRDTYTRGARCGHCSGPLVLWQRSGYNERCSRVCPSYTKHVLLSPSVDTWVVQFSIGLENTAR